MGATHFELYSDGLGTISQFIAIKFGPQLSAGIHRGGTFSEVSGCSFFNGRLGL